MAFNFASPLPLLCILGQLQFETVSFSQPRCVRWRRDKLRATQVEITFARPFRWQSKAMPEFKLSLEKIRAQPIDRRGAQLTCTDCFCARPCDCRTWAKHGLVITQHLRITDAAYTTGVHGRTRASPQEKYYSCRLKSVPKLPSKSLWLKPLMSTPAWVYPSTSGATAGS